MLINRMAVETGSLVTKTTLAQMFTRQKTREGQDIPFGLGWAVGVRKAQKKVWHLGGAQGVSTILFMRPEQGLAVVLLLNMGGLSTPPATAPILELACQVAELVSPSPLAALKGPGDHRARVPSAILTPAP
jgi:CubicO group peptidase (beta-lactamase class C family)